MKPSRHLINNRYSLHKNFSKLLFVFLSIFASVQLHADLIINWAGVDGGNSIPLGTNYRNVKFSINVRSETGTGWWSTAYRLDNGTCYNDPFSGSDRASVPQSSVTNTFDSDKIKELLEKLPSGKHNITFVVSSDWWEPCTQGTRSQRFTIQITKEGYTFDCNKLYMVRDNGDFYSFNNPTVDAVVGSRLLDLKGKDTIAIGPWGREDGGMTLHYWDWLEKSNIDYTFTGVRDGGYTISAPEASHNYWSGGEANQMTGEVYFSSGEDSTINNDFRLGIYNTANGNFRKSGQLSPATPSDNIGDVYVSSDMAIDAKGNAYVLVRNGNNHELMRIIVGKNGESWKYNRVKTIVGIDQQELDIWGMAFLNGKLYAGNWHLFEINPLTGRTQYKGEVRDRPSPTTGNRYFLDLATCQVAAIIEGKVYYDKDGDGILTDAEKNAAGVANVNVDIHDSNGVKIGGVTTSGDGSYTLLLPNTNTIFYVRLNQPALRGANAHQTWASGGRYSWAGQYRAGNNTVTPKCYNDHTLSNKQVIATNKIGIYPQNIYDKYGIACYGAKADGVDPSGIINISQANYYSQVNITTDRAVIEADFALGPVDRSDAPVESINGTTYNFGEAAHARTGGIYLGDKVDAELVSFANNETSDINKINAASDDNSGVKDDDDSVEVKEWNATDPDAFEPIQNFEFINGNLYNFRVKVQSKGYLNAWANFYNGATLRNYTFTNEYTSTKAGRFVTNNVVNNDGNYTELVYNNGYLEFNYTIPDTSYIDNNANHNNTTKAYMRFRYTNTSISNMSFKDEPRGNSYWNSHTWAIGGEVEDYMVRYHYIPRPNFVPANLTVVNENFDKKSEDIFDIKDHSKIGLFTQIAKKPFNATIVAHNDGVILEKFEQNVTVIIDFVEDNLSAPECSLEYMPLLERLGNITLEGNKTDAVVKRIQTNLTKVTRNGTFMLTYYYSDSSHYNTTTCSDSFALRPATFKLDGFSGNLIGGKIISGNISALDNSGATALLYNQSQNKINHQNSTLVPYYPDCNETEINLTVTNGLQINTTSFNSGKSNMNISYDNIGVIDTSFVDDDWTRIDNDPNKNDCIPNNSTNIHAASGKYKGRVGCDIALNGTLKFIPAKFTNTLQVSNFNGGTYTYLSDNNSMHANINVGISAVLDGGGAASNYHQNCFAHNVTYSVKLINENLTDWDNRGNSTYRIKYFTTGSTADVTYGNENNDTGGAVLSTSQGNFSGGIANTKFGFNFGREEEVEKPFTAFGKDFNVTSVKDSDGVKGEGVEIEEGEEAGKAKFYYGRTHSKLPEYSVYGNETNATIYYEVYCDNCNKSSYVASMRLDGEYPQWYINNNHDALAAGNVTKFEVNLTEAYLTVDTSINTPKYSSYNVQNGQEILGVNKDSSINYTPYKVTIEIQPHSWLHNDPKFDVIFKGSGGDWAGHGQSRAGNATGRVIRENPSGDKSIRMDW
ncbi:MAG: hypothetical protein LBT96_04320 [Campylobacteraceae bacterium]|jgi:hypothetical protein|nr:hypothetical protein [Campylobacteraceae bacterium]